MQPIPRPSVARPSLHDIVAATGAWKPPAYLPVYEQFFEPLRHLPLAVLELGIYRGGSMRAWEAYFPHARIAGIDAQIPAITVGERVSMFAGNQTDCGFLTRVANAIAPEGFDIIIDDCSHIGTMSKISFWHLFDKHLKPGGLYCIEDWGTGYLGSWPDGRNAAAEPDSDDRMPSHDAGMVGFIKQLVDELHAHATTSEARPSRFANMMLSAPVCVITKVGRPPRAADSVAERPAFGPLYRLIGRLSGRAPRGQDRERAY
jgi:hypothetical protein